MPLDLPENSRVLTQQSKTDFQGEVSESDPFLRDSWIGASITANAQRVFDFYLTLQQAIRQTFPNTATGDFLENDHAIIWGLTRNPATRSDGLIIATGTLGTSIPDATPFQSQATLLYTSTAAVSILARTISVVSITRSGTTATVTTDGDHNLTSEVTVDITGAVETDYNGTGIEIIPLTATTFSYQVENNPTTPATGTIIVAYETAEVPVLSDDYGLDTVQEANAALSLTNPIAGIDSDNRVSQDGLSGGTDLETDSELQTRLLRRIANPVANFNVGQIDFEARKVSGVTRVWVFEASPFAGAVAVYFVRDNDADIIPSTGEVATVRAQILAIKPASLDPDNLLVAGPTAVPTSFTFSSITPDTATMREAVTESLDQFFKDFSNVGVSIVEDAYRSAIINTIDTVTGETLSDFVLASPTADIPVAIGELAILGTVSYP